MGVDADSPLPILALTMGDAAGVGPEVVARAIDSTKVLSVCQPTVVGSPEILERALQVVECRREIISVESVNELRQRASHTAFQTHVLCWNPTSADVESVVPGRLCSLAGQAAYDWLIAATDAALAGQIDGIVTAPLNKAALHLSGHYYPGHTEILAERCGVSDFAMMLYLPPGDVVQSEYGLGVAHVTLHTSLASVPKLISTEGVQEKIHLVDQFLKSIGCQTPRIGVCALNPHAGENGLFGDEETSIISPAVEAVQVENVNAFGPLPADTLLQQAVSGAYDGIVAMYHDQGHIALKLIAFQRAVNVTLGLPIVRTSPSHGTAFDIAWQNKVDSAGMISAIQIAAELISSQCQSDS